MIKSNGEPYTARLLQEQAGGYEWGRFIAGVRLRNNRLDYPLRYAAKSYEINEKAAIVLFGLQDLIGEKEMNHALREFKNEFAFRSKPPFASVADLYRYLKKYTPDSVQYYLRDNWENITFYDNKVLDAKMEKSASNDGFSVRFTLQISKVYVDSLGAEIQTPPINDYIDVAIFGPDIKSPTGIMIKNPIWFRKIKLGKGARQFDIKVKSRPTQVGVDPYHKLIDRSIWDNTRDLMP